MIVVVVGSTFFADLFGFINIRYENNNIGKNEVIQIINDKLEKKEIVVDELRTEIEKLRDEVRSCKSNNQLLDAIKTDIPIAIWLKDKKSTIIYLNKSYEKIVLEDIGSNNIELLYTKGYSVFGKEVVDNFIKNDLVAMKSSKPTYSIEYTFDSQNNKVYLLSCKYPRYISGVLVGTGGFAIRMTDIESIITKN